MIEFLNLVKIMERLRSPKDGCPWDRKQTPESLREHIIEEAYELVEAIEMKSIEKQKEELGDLLLQIVFLSCYHQEQENFGIKEVIETISQKLIRRHPHIFGDTTVNSAEEVKQNWEKIKNKEKKRKSILSDYPVAMPALSIAKRIGEQAAHVGFDWETAAQALEKVEEEIAELKEAMAKGQEEKISEEMGDMLFAIANVARLSHINPEFALRQANQKFIARFRYLEEELKKQGKDIRKTSLDEMELLWQEAKKKEL